uniref:Uncharacterized protein n=1 Tax=Fagus sylvatica TaxID=28930 RepID=A0A2N9FUG4_FAGSY
MAYGCYQVKTELIHPHLFSSSNKRNIELEVDQIKSAALDQIQIQQIKSLSLSDIIPSQLSLPSANSDSVSYSPSELRIFGVTDDLRDFVKGLTSTTFQNFPIKGEQWITELARRTLSVCDNL